MEELARIISEFGVTIIIVALFIWDWISNRKDMKNSLEEMAKTNNNTAKSLELLQKSMENQEKNIEVIEKSNDEKIFLLKDIQDKVKEILEKIPNK